MLLYLMVWSIALSFWFIFLTDSDPRWKVAVGLFETLALSCTFIIPVHFLVPLLMYLILSIPLSLLLTIHLKA